jgi:hypothetical protein
MKPVFPEDPQLVAQLPLIVHLVQIRKHYKFLESLSAQLAYDFLPPTPKRNTVGPVHVMQKRVPVHVDRLLLHLWVMPGYFLGQPAIATAQSNLHTFAHEIFVC